MDTKIDHRPVILFSSIFDLFIIMFQYAQAILFNHLPSIAQGNLNLRSEDEEWQARKAIGTAVLYHGDHLNTFCHGCGGTLAGKRKVRLDVDSV
jgi:hypothetical protein